ncbi:MAG: thermonuclease family protein [Planctomyces sp.]|nr:thermonuclease family protein [Planctomyces sp.]
MSIAGIPRQFRQAGRGPYRRRPTAALIVILIAALLAIFRTQTPPVAPQGLPPEGEVVRVARVVDGDTLLLDGGRRVRLIGVNTPETKIEGQPPEPWGPEASEFVTRLVEGRNVTLEYDRERRDQYDRILAYVHHDGRLLNEEIIRAGYSRAVLRFPYRSDRKRLFQAAEEEAREARRGLWSGDPPARPRGSPAP